MNAPAKQLSGRSPADRWEQPRDGLALIENRAITGTSSNLFSSTPGAANKPRAYKMQGHDAMGRPFVRRILSWRTLPTHRTADTSFKPLRWNITIRRANGYMVQ